MYAQPVQRPHYQSYPRFRPAFTTIGVDCTVQYECVGGVNGTTQGSKRAAQYAPNQTIRFKVTREGVLRIVADTHPTFVRNRIQCTEWLLLGSIARSFLATAHLADPAYEHRVISIGSAPRSWLRAQVTRHVD